MAVKQPTSGPGFHKPCKKIDVHVHLAKANNGMGFTPEDRIAFDKYMDVEKCVILPTFTGEIPAGFPAEAAAKMLTNEDACAIAEKYPDHFAWFCNVSPKQDPQTY